MALESPEEQEKITKEAEERKMPPVHVVYETIRLEGEHEIARTPAALAFSGLAAGLSMSFSFIASGLLRAFLPSTEWAPLITNLGYTTGFVIVIMGRQQLFTENTLTPILPLLAKPRSKTVFKVLRLWLIVLVANVIGTAIVAYIIIHSGAFQLHVQDALRALSREVYAGSFGEIFWRGFFGGWLIALTIWLIPTTEGGATLAIVIVVTYVVGLGKFSHIIAGSVDALYAVFNGTATVSDFFGRFFVPTLLGNIVGGVVIVSLLGFAQVKPDSAQT